MAGDEDLGREPLPAELRRRVLVEAGHRCAIPTCRYIEVEIHHIVPWAKCQRHEYENLIALCPNCHRRADREEIDRKSLRLYKLNLRFVHEKYSQLEMDLLFMLAGSAEGYPALWAPFAVLMLKRVLDAELLEAQQSPGGIAKSFGMQISPVHLRITSKGREFVKELGLHEL